MPVSDTTCTVLNNIISKSAPIIEHIIIQNTKISTCRFNPTLQCQIFIASAASDARQRALTICFVLYRHETYEAGLSCRDRHKNAVNFRTLYWKKYDTPSVSPAALYIVGKSCRQHEYDVRRISKFFKLTEETLKYIMYKVIQTTYICLFALNYVIQ